MTFYLVRDPDGHDPSKPIWLAWNDTDNIRMYTYLPNIQAFALHAGLHQDWRWDQELDYEEIPAEQAAQIIAEGTIGYIKPNSHRRYTLQRLSEAPLRRSITDVLGPDHPIPG